MNRLKKKRKRFSIRRDLFSYFTDPYEYTYIYLLVYRIPYPIHLSTLQYSIVISCHVIHQTYCKSIPLLEESGLSTALKLSVISWTVLRVDGLLLDAGDLERVSLGLLNFSPSPVSALAESRLTITLGIVFFSLILSLSSDITVFTVPEELAVSAFFVSLRFFTQMSLLGSLFSVFSSMFSCSSVRGCFLCAGLACLFSWSISETLTFDCFPKNKYCNVFEIVHYL